MSHEVEEIIKAFGQLNPAQILYLKELVLPSDASLPNEDFINTVKERLVKQKSGCPVCGSLYNVQSENVSCL
jgi:hypothetical protein